MIDLEMRVGRWSLRVWGLIVNFAANALTLYGAAGVLRDGSRWPFFVIGFLITVGCLLVLAIPTPDQEVTNGRWESTDD